MWKENQQHLIVAISSHDSNGLVPNGKLFIVKFSFTNHQFAKSNGALRGVSSSRVSKSDGDGEGSSNPPVKVNGDIRVNAVSSLFAPDKNSISASPDGDVCKY